MCSCTAGAGGTRWGTVTCAVGCVPSELTALSRSICWTRSSWCRRNSTSGSTWLPDSQPIHGYGQALRFRPEAAHVARSNRLGWEAMQEEPDGSVVVTLAVPDLVWAASMALSYGPIVTVLEPEELRSVIREWAQAVAAQYSDPDRQTRAEFEQRVRDQRHRRNQRWKSKRLGGVLLPLRA